MRRAATTLCAALAFAAVATGTARAQTTCVGDCNGDGMVLVNELVLGVNIALGLAPLSMCPSFDANHDGTVTVSDLIQGVNNALNGCPMGPTPTATTGIGPTATVTPSGGTERIFTIEPGMGFAPPEGSRSGLFSDIIAANGATMIPPGPLTLVMGTANSEGVASLSLKDDVTLSILTADGNCLCMKLMSAGTTGSIDCDGGTAYDTMAVRPANAPNFEWTVATGLGTPSGPGNANLLIPALFAQVLTAPNGCAAPLDCNTFNFPDPPNVFAFTTTTATAKQGQGAGFRTYAVPGEAFDCATFTTPGKGMLAAPAPTTIPPVGETATVFRFGEVKAP